MEDSSRDIREDISLIRQILERCLDGMKVMKPWFTGLGMVWLIYGGFSAVQRLANLRVSVSVAQQLSRIGTVVGMLFCCVLAAGFIACRVRMKQSGLDANSMKLVNLWGICIFLFLAVTVLLDPVIRIVCVRLGCSAEAAASLYNACALGRSILFLMMPAAPLLITADFLEHRGMLMAGIILAVLAAFEIIGNALMLFYDGAAVSAVWKYLWFLTACLLDLVPGMMLLGFGWKLKDR